MFSTFNFVAFTCYVLSRDHSIRLTEETICFPFFCYNQSQNQISIQKESFY
jgi:hypothetical protein